MCLPAEYITDKHITMNSKLTTQCTIAKTLQKNIKYIIIVNLSNSIGATEIPGFFFFFFF